MLTSDSLSRRVLGIWVLQATFPSDVSNNSLTIQTIAYYRQKEACYGLDKFKGLIRQVRVMQMQPKCSYMIEYNVLLLILAKKKIKHQTTNERMSDMSISMQVARWSSSSNKDGAFWEWKGEIKKAVNFVHDNIWLYELDYCTRWSIKGIYTNKKREGWRLRTLQEYNNRRIR